MKYLDPSFEEIKEPSMARRVALAAHNCYQINKDDSPEAFLSKLMGFGHFAMFEHGRFAVEASPKLYQEIRELNNPFIVAAAGAGHQLLAFSYRPLLEDPLAFSALIDILPASDSFLFPSHAYQTPAGHLLSPAEIDALPPELYKKVKPVTLKIITDRGVTHELVRHRVASYAQESTRYCNYAKDKFGSELTFIRPLDYGKFQDIYDAAFKNAEASYFALLQAGSTPEMARAVLPNKLKAAIIITAYVDEFERIFALRCDQRAHPDMRQIMLPIQDYFKKEGYLR
jgi:hypothetical protein